VVAWLSLDSDPGELTSMNIFFWSSFCNSRSFSGSILAASKPSTKLIICCRRDVFDCLGRIVLVKTCSSSWIVSVLW
jgi:hypothetical protein